MVSQETLDAMAACLVPILDSVADQSDSEYVSAKMRQERERKRRARIEIWRPTTES